MMKRSSKHIIPTSPRAKGSIRLRSEEASEQQSLKRRMTKRRQTLSQASRQMDASTTSRKRSHQAWLSAFLCHNPTTSLSLSPRTPPPPTRHTNGDLLASPPTTRRVTSALDPFECEEEANNDDSQPQSRHAYPIQARFQSLRRNLKSQLLPAQPSITGHHEVIGDPSLRIHKLRLPPHLLHILDTVVMGCESYAATLANGWRTDLYSLTKQDIALREIPHLFQVTKPISDYIKRAIAHIFGVHSVTLDRNQPHVLKYSADDGLGHTGVELHHDKCDVTANLSMSRSTSYIGGGTLFPDAGKVVKLEFGEFLLHPGGLVHAGMNITSGTRYLMVIFANAK